MALKIDRPTIRIPTFELPKPQPVVTNKFPAFSPMNSSFEPAGAPPPMVMPQLPPNPASIPGYGTPDALKDVFEDLSRSLPGLQGGVSEEARKAAVAQARDTIIAKGRERGLDLMLNKKANGDFSLDAVAWRKPDGSVSIIDFGLASKDTTRPMKFQWLDVTDGGSAPLASEDPAFTALNGIFDGLIKAWSSKKGLKAGASPAERKATLEAVRDDLITRGRAAGLDISPNVNENGELALDSVVVKDSSGQSRLVNFAPDAMDLARDVNLKLPSLG